MNLKRTTRRLLAWSGALLGIAAAGSTSADAQIFQTVYGGEAADAARGGVLTISSSQYGPGFIAVGTSKSFGVDNDVYVIRTDLNGRIVWSTVYNIGGDDYGRKIRETNDSGFVIVGSTTDERGCCGANNIFLLRITEKGEVKWAKTYGGIEDDQGWDVKQTTYDAYTDREAFYVAGRTNSFTNGEYDGYLMKTDGDGNVIWGRIFGEKLDDYFYSLDLAAGGREIVATGGTNNFTWNGDADILITRVSAFDGSLNWAAHYGGERDDVARSIIELQNGNFREELALVGYTESLSGRKDAFILKVKSSGSFLDAHVIGDFGDRPEEFTELVEIKTDFGSERMGNLLVTGHFYENPKGFGDYDMVIGEFGAWAGLPTFWIGIYGDRKTEEGWGVTVAPGNPNSPAYSAVAVGMTSTFQIWGDEEVYMVRANRGGKSGCYDDNPEYREDYPYWPENHVKFCHPMIKVQCRARAVERYVDNSYHLCHSEGAAQPGNNGGTEGIGTRQLTERSYEILKDGQNGDGLAIEKTQPNPVRLGAKLNLSYSRIDATPVTVSVADMAGKVVFEQLDASAPGIRDLTIDTQGWAPGVYVVKVGSGEKFETMRVVVVE